MPTINVTMTKGSLTKQQRADLTEKLTRQLLSAPSTAPGQAETFVFPVTVALEETAVKIDNVVIPLTPA
jgi:phenylpyruvate tautomerase PptA (4-oxalocrotonate tautomerase family)